eukprot:2083586-Alexandrium_andersonii.AAC.1
MAAARTRGPACGAPSCCTCGGAEVHMRWPGSMFVCDPPKRTFPVTPTDDAADARTERVPRTM